MKRTLAIAALCVWPAPLAAQEAAQGLAEAQVAEDTGTAAGMVPPEEPYRPRYTARLSVDAIAAELAELARRHPERVRLETLGTSEGGRELSLLVLTDFATGAHDEKPGLLVVGDRGTGRPGHAEAEAALALAWELASGADGVPDAVLARSTVYVAPLLDPDARAGGAASPVDFDRSFPCGWLPGVLRPGSGAIPLGRPETLAVARFLDEHPNVALVVGRMPEPVSDARPSWSIAPEDRRTLAALCDPGPEGFAAWTVPAGASGSLFDYAYFAQGSFAVGWPAVSLGASQGGAGAFEARVLELVERAAGVAPRLPALTLAAGEPVRLSSELWRLDLRLANTGGLPTESALSRGRRGRELRLDVQGARLVASAVREPEQADFALVRVDEGGGRALGTVPLDAGAERWVRVILAAEPESQVTIGLQGAWAARVASTVLLP